MADNEPTIPDPVPAQDPVPAPEPRTFSQEDVDRIVQERLARAKTTPPADYEDLKTKAAELDQLRQSQMSELEKATQRAAQLEREAEQARLRTQDVLVKSAIVAEAARKNAVDPDAVVALVDRSALEFGDDGSPTNIETLVDGLLTAKPYLVGGSKGSADQGARGGAADQVALEQIRSMSDTEFSKALAEGKFNVALRGGK